MKTICSILFFLTIGISQNWLTDFETAKKEAKTSGKHILLNFSGSDWCGPCIKTKKDIFDKDTFKDYAHKSLVLVNADFPRQKKNLLSKEQKAHNEALSAKYNPKGILPYTILMDADGKILKEWVGAPRESADEFVEEIKKHH